MWNLFGWKIKTFLYVLEAKFLLLLLFYNVFKAKVNEASALLSSDEDSRLGQLTSVSKIEIAL